MVCYATVYELQAGLENTVSKNKRTFFFNLKTTGLIMPKSNIIIFFKLHSFKYFFINVVTIET